MVIFYWIYLCIYTISKFLFRISLILWPPPRNSTIQLAMSHKLMHCIIIHNGISLLGAIQKGLPFLNQFLTPHSIFHWMLFYLICNNRVWETHQSAYLKIGYPLWIPPYILRFWSTICKVLQILCALYQKAYDQILKSRKLMTNLFTQFKVGFPIVLNKEV